MRKRPSRALPPAYKAFNLLEKIAVFRIPVLVSKGLPTTMALERAEALGITIAGGVGTRKLRVYVHGERIKP